VKHRSQIALEKLDSTSMARFLTQSQFRKLHDALSYKAERMGLPVPVEVPAAYTSQTCSNCGHKAPENRPKHDSEGKSIQDVFQCVACGFQANADDNASEVIALRGLHQEINGGRFQKFDEFQSWLKEVKGRDGLCAKSV
jgi:transposase